MKEKILTAVTLCLSSIAWSCFGGNPSLQAATAQETPATDGIIVDADFPGGNIAVDRIEGDTILLQPGKRIVSARY